MRVKVGDTWYYAEDQPIAIQLTKTDRQTIENMPKENSMFAEFGAQHCLSTTPDERLDWLDGYEVPWKYEPNSAVGDGGGDATSCREQFGHRPVKG